ncbi:MAG: hypothetical protein QM784_32780 [Polyangiaceae bacterium]
MANRYLTAAWLVWGLSIASIPATAYLFHRFIAPDPTDDFGMGPFLSGVYLGGILSVSFGVTAAVLHAKARQFRPLGMLLSVLEWLLFVLPPALVLVFAAVLLGGAAFGVPIVAIALVLLALSKFRNRQT